MIKTIRFCSSATLAVVAVETIKAAPLLHSGRLSGCRISTPLNPFLTKISAHSDSGTKGLCLR